MIIKFLTFNMFGLIYSNCTENSNAQKIQNLSPHISKKLRESRKKLSSYQ
ncbi:hypothetical protein LguiB_009351 [Lonicera macranthoides]